MKTSILLAAGCLAEYALLPSSVPANPHEPFQHRIAYGDGEPGTAVTISWNTYAEVSQPTVHYGVNPMTMTHNATGDSVTYATSTSWSNHVPLSGLTPNTKYYYTVNDTNCYNCSETPAYTFNTARSAGDMASYSVAVVVDLGTMGKQGLSDTVGKGAAGALTPNDTNTIQSLVQYQDSYDFIYHPGDIAYADYWLKETAQGYLPSNNSNISFAHGVGLYNVILNEFFDEMQPVTAHKPYMVGPGNHEANCINGEVTDKATNVTYEQSMCMPGQQNFTGYINHYRMPGNTSNMWYSFNHGMTHYVTLSSETDLGNYLAPDAVGGPEKEASGPFGSKGQQIAWLKSDLAAVNRTETPWIIATTHRPWYVSGKNTSSDFCTVCKDVFEPLFLQYNVDLVMHGHVHVYERSQPIADYKPDPKGLNNPSSPWYIVNGVAGHYDGLDAFQLPLKNYSVVAQNSTYGWSRLTFHNRTHLTHEFVASANGSILDTATLFKRH